MVLVWKANELCKIDLRFYFIFFWSMIFPTYYVLFCQCPDAFFHFPCYFCALFSFYSLYYALPEEECLPFLYSSLTRCLYSLSIHICIFLFVISATLQHNVLSQPFLNLWNSLKETVIIVNDRTYGKALTISFLLSTSMPCACIIGLLALWWVLFKPSDIFHS